MKRTIKSFLTVACLALLGLGSVFSSTSAQAAVQFCTPYVPGSGFPNPGYPVSTGNLYFCFPTPRSTGEGAMQLVATNAVVGAVTNWTSAVRAQLNAKHVDFFVFYNGADAFQTLQIGSPDPAVKASESGRSWVLPNRTSLLPNPATAIFLFTTDQYTALNGRIPVQNDLNQTQLKGTTRHESAHHMDRVWAQLLNYAPTATAIVTNNTTNTNFGKAINLDGARLTAADIQTLKTLYPRLLINPTAATPTIANNEVFAESIAHFIGGGVRADEDTFIQAKFPCAYSYARNLYSSNSSTPIGTPKPDAVPSTACYGNTHW